MKTFHKALLVAVIAIFSFGYAAADLRFGVKAGMNFSKLNFKIKNMEAANNYIEDSRTGWMAGVMTEFTVPVVGVGMDLSLLYARQNVDNNPYYKNKDFIDIPLNLKWKIGVPVVGKIITPMVYTGPDFLFALNKNTFRDMKTKTCDVGWNLGIGVELLSHLQIEGGYCFGLNSVAKQTGLVNAEDLKVKKNYWSLTAAYLF